MSRLEDTWEVIRPLGRGSSGEVVEVRHRIWGHRAAAKRVPHAQSFEAEVRAIAQLDDPHVVALFDQGSGPPPWMVMELARGTVGPPGDYASLRTVLAAVLRALAVAHAAGVLHLDVKPSNVLVRQDGSITLADFGVSRSAEEGAETGGGSLPYMAPERLLGATVGPTADLFGLGGLGWALTTGAPPRSATTWAQARAAASAPLPAFSPRFAVPTGLEAWLTTLLGPAADRPERASVALWQLESLGPPVVSGAAPPGSRSTTTTVPTTQVGVRARVVVTMRPASHPVPAHWPESSPRRRPETVGLGLLERWAPPFVGRDAAKRTLWEALAAPHPSVVVLCGPSGVGRTRLGEAFAQAAAAHAGATVFRTVDEAVAATGRRVLWLDDATDLHVPQSDDLTVVVAIRAPRLSPQQQREAAEIGAQVVDVAPLEPGVVRTLFANWCGLSPELVAQIADSCQGDLARAVALVRDGVRRGTLTPSPHGLRASVADPFPSPRSPPAPSSPALTPMERWARGCATLGSDTVAEAVEDLYLGSALAIASGQMAAAARVFARARRLVDPHDALSEARLCRGEALLGPTYQGYARVQELNERAVELARPHDALLDWKHVLTSSLSGLVWLALRQRRPHRARTALAELVAVQGASSGILLHRAEIALQQGGPAEAVGHSEASIARARVVGNRHVLAVALVELEKARVLLSGATAIPDLTHAVERMLGEFGLESARADGALALANAHRRAGHLDRAGEHYEAALAALAAGEVRGDLGARLDWALWHHERGDDTEATALLLASRGRLRDEGPVWEALFDLHLAAIQKPGSVSPESVAAWAALEGAGYCDPDVLRAAQRCGLTPRPSTGISPPRYRR